MEKIEKQKWHDIFKADCDEGPVVPLEEEITQDGLTVKKYKIIDPLTGLIFTVKRFETEAKNDS